MTPAVQQALQQGLELAEEQHLDHVRVFLPSGVDHTLTPAEIRAILRVAES